MIKGKTKTVTPLWKGADIGLVKTKDDITAGDGAKHDIMFGKAELATRTNCNVMEYLRGKDISVAFIGRDGPTTFLTRICNMIPVEVVVRRIAFGSYCKRNPDVEKGMVFEEPVVEFFYKTSEQRINNRELPCDDPLMIWSDMDGDFSLYRPDHPFLDGHIGRLDSFITVPSTLVGQLNKCRNIAADVSTHLHDAWHVLGGTLYDFKLEFGVLSDGTIVLADVVDCDSWRVQWQGVQLSKQGYRDGDELNRVLGVYRLAASLTDQLV